MDKILDLEIENLEARFLKVLGYISLKDYQKANMTLDDIRNGLIFIGVIPKPKNQEDPSVFGKNLLTRENLQRL